MIVLEHLIGEMKMRGGYKDRRLCNLVNFHQTRTWCDGNCSACKLSNPITVLEYLNKEYQEPIEMSQFEYDLLQVATKYRGHSSDDTIENYTFLNYMARMGYFANVNEALTIKQILERAVIVNE